MERKAIVLLHEIYGVNDFIKEEAKYFESKGFSVFCPNLIGREAFPYKEGEKAYKYFMDKVGIGVKEALIGKLISLKGQFDKVILVGYSVGASLAWIHGRSELCDAIICFYGSRIREHIKEIPKVYGLLIFSEEERFSDCIDYEGLEKHNIGAKHGFMDQYNKNYDKEAFLQTRQMLEKFLESHS